MKYKVKTYVVDYRIAEMEVEANSKAEAIEKAYEMVDNGDANYELDHYKTWRKPTVQRVKP